MLPSISDVDVGWVSARLPRPPLPSISASTRSTVGSEYDDAPNEPTKPAAVDADASVGVRDMLRGSRSARRAFRHRSWRGTLAQVLGCRGAGTRSAVRDEEGVG